MPNAHNGLERKIRNRGRFLCAGASQIDPGVIHTAGDSFWLRPGC
jgi:hypothetical protein